MATPQEMRKIRLKNDYKEMQNIRSFIIQWRPLQGEPPYVEAYELTVGIRTIISPRPGYRDSHIIKVALPSNYPHSPPSTSMETSPQPYHPNWYPNGNWCCGHWDISEGLGHHVVRMIRTLQFDPEITNPDSAANGEAKRWYLTNNDRGWFPCDRQVLPDPTQSRFEIHVPTRKRFVIQ